MRKFLDIDGREIRLEREEKRHIEENHPEITMEMIAKALKGPDVIRESVHKEFVNLYYHLAFQR